MAENLASLGGAGSTDRGAPAVMATSGPVAIIGTGLIGTSIALGLQEAGIEVFLQDTSPTSLALAVDMGAGERLEEAKADSIKLAIVAAPPDVAGSCVVDALRCFPHAVVTDVASVKTSILAEVEKAAAADRALPVAHYVGSHPMAGRAYSGAAAAQGDLFVGRPWVIVPTPHSRAEATLAVRNLAVDLGAVPLEMQPQEHDRAVALISHVPQLVSSLLAARLEEATLNDLSLVGQGLRDTTRIAASDPKLWTAIIAANREPIVEILQKIRGDLQDLIDRIGGDASGGVGAVHRVIASGNRGVERIPGKHGGTRNRWAAIEVLVPDEPGELGRLFSELGSVGINIEDLQLEHSAKQPVGLARLLVNPQVVDVACQELEERGWRIASIGGLEEQR